MAARVELWATAKLPRAAADRLRQSLLRERFGLPYAIFVSLLKCRLD
jgi:hypothetical protein